MAKGHIRICGRKCLFSKLQYFVVKVCIVYHVLAAKCRLDLISSSTGSKVRKQVISSIMTIYGRQTRILSILEIEQFWYYWAK